MKESSNGRDLQAVTGEAGTAAAAAALDRRGLIGGLAALALGAAAVPAAAADALAALERGTGGRFGFCALDRTGAVLLAHRADERFLLCSTFKTFLAGAVLDEVERGRLALSAPVPVSAADLVVHAPAVEAALGRGTMTIEELCAAATVLSDNAAANLLLGRIGGPPALTRFFARLGGRPSRLDRREPALNVPSGRLDTTTPRAAARMLRALLDGPVLDPANRDRIERWMVDTKTGLGRLRAGLPPQLRAGDKTGTGPNGIANDIAFADLPGGRRIYLAAYLDGPALPAPARDARLAAAARHALAAVAPPPAR